MGSYRDAMDQEMARRGLAPRTRKTYLGCMRRLVSPNTQTRPLRNT